MRLRSSLPGGLALLAMLAGCGSDPAPKPAPRTEGDEVRLEVLAKCRAFGERLYARAAPCCESQPGFSEAEFLRTWLTETCSPVASVIAEGLATYDDAAEEACFEAHALAYDTCTGDWDEIVARREHIWSVCKTVRGTREPGETCDTDALCAPAEGATRVSCLDGVCTVRHLFLPAGADCPFPHGDVSTCSTGLYCSALAKGDFGTCLPATPLGESCEPDGDNAECGTGNYCDLEAAVCRKATNFGGPSCTTGRECVSFVCERGPMTCTEPPPLDDCKIPGMP
ncbi:MAG TPA: hypothetical protein VGK73_18475 [Polyangiaceae bacterium]